MKDRFYQYCLERDLWIELKNEGFKYSPYMNDEISKAALARLYNETYQANISDDTARNEYTRIEIIYNKDCRMNGTRGTFTNLRIIP